MEVLINLNLTELKEWSYKYTRMVWFFSLLNPSTSNTYERMKGQAECKLTIVQEKHSVKQSFSQMDRD